MLIKPLQINGLYVIEPLVHEDSRGFFLESYNAKIFEENNLKIDFIQDNHSLSKDIGVLRGLHYQLAPKAQTKLIRVLKGAIYDVAVDIRKNSSTFGNWIGIELNAVNKKQLLIPKGFAHGFCTLEPDTEVAYKVDEYYSPAHDRGIKWNDADLGIDWPIQEPILSLKDSNHMSFKEANINFFYEELQ